MSEKENQKGLRPLLILLIILALAVIGLYFINQKNNQLSDTTSTTPTNSSSDNPAVLPTGDTFTGKLACLPSGDQYICIYSLHFQDHYYKLNGLSQQSLIDAEFNIDDQVTVTGKINQDSIEVTSISSN